MEVARIDLEDSVGTARPVVAGVGGYSGLSAARFAAEEALLRRRPLVLVHAFMRKWVEPPFAPIGPTARQVACDLLAALAARLRHDHPGLTVHTEAVEGHPAAVLEERSRRAELLVLGYRGGSGVAELLVGSVAEHVARHAHCAVTLVPHDPDNAAR